MTPAAPCRLSVVIVTYNHRQELARGLRALLPELDESDQLIVSDNASTDGTRELVRELAPGALLVEREENDGFAAACNDGVEAATGDLVVLLNPDTIVSPGWRAGIVRPWLDGDGWAAWMALVTMEDGRRINTSGGVTHFTGISWAGQVGRPVDEAPREPREVAFASGACLAIPRERWESVGGMPADFFLYHEDVDLSLRLLLEGRRVMADPRVRVDHGYEFSKGALKWRLLERNRWATLLRCYPGPLLAVLAPALLATEAALFAVAFAGGWGPQKLLAAGDVIAGLPRVLRERRAIQARRTVSSLDFARRLTSDLDSPYLGRVGRSRALRALLRAYWRLALAALRATR